MFATRYKDGPELYSPLPLCLCITRLRKRPADDESPPYFFALSDDDPLSCSYRVSRGSFIWFPQDIRIRLSAGVSRTNIRARTRRVVSNSVWLTLISVLAFFGLIGGLALNMDFISIPVYVCFWISLIFPAQFLLTMLDLLRPKDGLQQHLHARLDAQPKGLPCRMLTAPPPKRSGSRASSERWGASILP